MKNSVPLGRMLSNRGPHQTCERPNYIPTSTPNVDKLIHDGTYILSMQDGYFVEFHYDDGMGIHVGFVNPLKLDFIRVYLDAE